MGLTTLRPNYTSARVYKSSLNYNNRAAIDSCPYDISLTTSSQGGQNCTARYKTITRNPVTGNVSYQLSLLHSVHAATTVHDNKLPTTMGGV